MVDAKIYADGLAWEGNIDKTVISQFMSQYAYDPSPKPSWAD
jgi:hypothetical protein